MKLLAQKRVKASILVREILRPHYLRELPPAPGGYCSFGAGSITFSKSSACLYGLLEA